MLAAAVVAAATLVLFRRALFSGETFVARDLDSYYRPAKILLVRLVHEARGVPLWNPYFSFGQPFAANPEHELFHPATWLLLVLPFEWAFRLPIVLAPALAALSMLFFLRTAGRSREAAAFAALSWGFGGYLLSTFNLLPILYGVVPLPAALAFLVRAWRGGRWRDAAGLAVTGGLVGLAGEPSTLLCGALLAPAALAAGASGRPARAGPVAAGLALAAGLAAPALLPGALHASRTVRARGIASAEAGEWAFPPLRVAELAYPHVLGSADTERPEPYWGHALYPGKGFPFLLGVHPGLFVTALAALAAFAVRQRRTVAFTVAALAAIAVGVGPALPLWEPLHRLPLLRGMRYPEKLVLVASFALVVLAAHGWDALRLARLRRAAVILVAALGAVAVAGAIAAAFLPAAAALARGLLASAVTAALWAALLLVRRGARFALAAGLLAVELVSAGALFVPTRPIARVRRPRPALAPLVRRPPPGPIVAPVAEGNEFDALEPRPAAWGIATALGGDFDLTNLAWSDRATALFWKAANADAALLPHLLARRGVALLVTRRGGVPAYAAPAGRQPFAFFASRVEPIASEEAWVDAVRRLGPAVRETVCLFAPDARGIPERPAAGRVLALKRSPDRVEIGVAVAGSGPALLAVNQTWAPDWRAEVDGREAPLLRADVDLSALVVPPGARRVALSYRDASVPAAEALALAALAAAALLARAR